MPTSSLIGQVLNIKDAKVAKRTGSGTYNAAVDVFGVTQLSATARVAGGTRSGDSAIIDATGRIIGGQLTLAFAAPNFDVLTEITGLPTTSAQSDGDNEVRTFRVDTRTMPYFGLAGAADDSDGNEGVFHVWAPKLKITSDFTLVELQGDDGVNYPAFQATVEAVRDNAYVNGAQNEVQTLTVDATGGNYTLSLGGQTTSAIAHDDNAAAIQAALVALSNIGSGNVAVTGTGPFTITFQGDLASLKIRPLVVADSTTGGDGVSLVRTTAGSEGTDLIVAMYEVEAGTSVFIPPVL